MAENPAYEDQQANQFGKYVKLRLLCWHLKQMWAKEIKLCCFLEKYAL